MSSRSPQPHLLPRLARWMVVSLICISLGLQWTVLQGIAWTGMLISYTRDGSLIEAVTKTFDGEHPCALCKAVKKGQKQDPDKSAQTSMKKQEAVLAEVLRVIPPAPVEMEFSTFRQEARQRTMAPPRTPPRQHLA